MHLIGDNIRYRLSPSQSNARSTDDLAQRSVKASSVRDKIRKTKTILAWIPNIILVITLRVDVDFRHFFTVCFLRVHVQSYYLRCNAKLLRSGKTFLANRWRCEKSPWGYGCCRNYCDLLVSWYIPTCLITKGEIFPLRSPILRKSYELRVIHDWDF